MVVVDDSSCACYCVGGFLLVLILSLITFERGRFCLEEGAKLVNIHKTKKLRKNITGTAIFKDKPPPSIDVQKLTMGLTDLANELLLEILYSCSSVKDALNLGATCHRLHRVSHGANRLPILYAAAEAQLGKSNLNRTIFALVYSVTV